NSQDFGKRLVDFDDGGLRQECLANRMARMDCEAEACPKNHSDFLPSTQAHQMLSIHHQHKFEIVSGETLVHVLQRVAGSHAFPMSDQPAQVRLLEYGLDFCHRITISKSGLLFQPIGTVFTAL